MINKLIQYINRIIITGFWSSKLSGEDLRVSLKMLKPFFWMGFLGMLGQALKIIHLDEVGAMLLWSMAAMSFGTAVGFLFGVPKSGFSNPMGGEPKAIANGGSSRPNTNLEEISDWLTKIIVGLTLVNTESIMNIIGEISHKISNSMTTPTVGLALSTGFLTVGFLYGYFYTRLFLQKAFVDSDSKLNNLNQVLNAITSNPIPDLPVSGEPVRPTITEIKNAQLISTLVPKDKPDIVLDSIANLASSYDRVRTEMPTSIQRTKWMSGIASRIRQFGQAAIFLLPQLTVSNKEGERLAAICILQMNFQSSYIDWLAQRLYLEKRFPAYLAASALYERLASADNVESAHIRKTVKEAQTKITVRDDGCDTLINKIISYGATSQG